MVYVRSRKFCCCLPVRLGVFILTALGLLLGALLSVAGWTAVMKFNQDTLLYDDSQKIATYVEAAVFSLFTLLSLFGLIGTLTKKRTFVKAYFILLACMFLLSLASGAFNLYSAFHTKSPQDLQRCIGSAGGAGGSVTANTNGVAGNVASNTNGVADAQGLDEKARTAVCEGANMVVKVITVAMYIAVWLVELYAVIIVQNYAAQLEEEEAAELSSSSSSTINTKNTINVGKMDYPVPPATYYAYGNRDYNDAGYNNAGYNNAGHNSAGYNNSYNSGYAGDYKV